MKSMIPLFLILPSFMLASCQNGPAQITRIAFEKTAYTLKVNETVALKTILEGGTRNVTFASTNEDVVRVDKNGVATAISAGEAMVFGICNDLIARCSIEVIDENTEDDYRQYQGNYTLRASMPAFNLNGLSENAPIAVTYRDMESPILIEASLPKNELLSSSLAYEHSPYIEQNPTHEIPESYSSYVCALNGHAEGEGVINVKSYYDGGALSTHFFDGAETLGVIEQQSSETASLLPLLPSILPSLFNGGSYPLDLLNALLEEKEYAFDEPKTRFLRSIIAYADVMFDNHQDYMAFTLTLDEKVETDFFACFGETNLGEHSLSNITVNARFSKPGEHLQLTWFLFEMELFLYGEKNECSLQLSFPNESSPITSTEFAKLIEDVTK